MAMILAKTTNVNITPEMIKLYTMVYINMMAKYQSNYILKPEVFSAKTTCIIYSDTPNRLNFTPRRTRYEVYYENNSFVIRQTGYY
jgi:hypothetical protein